MDKNSLKVKTLEEAFNSFVDIINTYASQHDLPEDDRKQLLRMVTDAYCDKKIEYFLEDRLNKFGSFLNFSLDFALKSDNSKDRIKVNRIGYIKHLQQLITNE
ncbi:hypothetical protein [Viscerimonas tarda]